MFKTNSRLFGPTSGQLTILSLFAVLLLAIFLIVPRAQAGPQPDADLHGGKGFACGASGRLQMMIDQHFSAVVVSPSGQRFTLPNRPVEQGLVRIRWSDGVHTLTWDPGVQITWQDGRDAAAVACNREGSHRHGAPGRSVPGHQHGANRT